MNCPFCGSDRVRSSRFRVMDIPRSLLLRFPVRCRDCEERFHVPNKLAREVRRATEQRRLERISEEANRSGAERGS